MISNLVTACVPVFFLLIGFVPLLGLVYLRGLNEKRQRQSPLTGDLLRSPGHSLRKKLDDIDLEIESCLVVFIYIPLALFASHVSQSYYFGEPESVLRMIIVLLAGAGFFAAAAFQTWKLLNERQSFRLGLYGELAVGEELNQLMLDGCRVFHDVPIQYGNIDHVVVSRSGVYSVNTKMLGKPRSGDGNADVTVDHDKNVMRFPDRTVPIPCDQLETEAKCLSGFLKSAVGEPVDVEPMLALPGWFVKNRIGRGSVYVFNPKKPQKFFIRSRSALSPALIQRVAHQLEQLCRDVEPSFREKKAWGDG